MTLAEAAARADELAESGDEDQLRKALELDPRHAVIRAAAQQAVTWLVFVALYGTSVALAPRVLEWFA